VLADLPIVAPNELTSLRAAGVTVILLAANRMNPALRTVLAAGLDGLMTTHDSLAHMAEALEHGVAGKSYASPSAARLLLEEYPRRAQQPAFRREGNLSVRELQVLGAMVDGLTTKGTASRLGVAVKTVEAHRARLFAHLGVRNQREAITAALTDPDLSDSLTGRSDIRT
jgi:DNA-binding NarL/FixJ family response regulator